MNLRRRQFLHLAAGALGLPNVAVAQGYPTRAIRIVVGFPAGGNSDLFARMAGEFLSARLGQPCIIENRSGAGGNIATETVLKSPPDGYTLLLTTAADAWNATLYRNLKFDFVDDIAPVAWINRAIGVLVVNPSLSPKTASDFIAYTKANPGKISVATAGVGSAPYIYAKLFKSLAGVDILEIPYRGDAPALTDLIGGQVQAYFVNLGAAIEHIKEGRLRALAVTTAARAEALPGVPSLGEFVPGYDADGWSGIVAPKGTPVYVVERLNMAINEGLADPVIEARIMNLGSVATPTTPGKFGNFIREFSEKWRRIIQTANIKVE
jgi:tripartite-type tricarboxylate transporter receptor subunit TctC